jgi:hypothetical protein
MAKYGKLDLGQIEAIVNKLGGMEGVRKFLAEETVVAPTPSTIYVDRTIPANYPDWVKEILYDELEKKFPGPAEFDAGKLEQWLHDGQKNGYVTGNIIHQHLKDHDMLKDCLGLRDLEEIQKKGITFFRKHFKGKAVFGWKAVVRSRDDNLGVPYLYEGGGRVCLSWHWLAYGWHSFNPALLLAST